MQRCSSSPLSNRFTTALGGHPSAKTRRFGLLVGVACALVMLGCGRGDSPDEGSGGAGGGTGSGGALGGSGGQGRGGSDGVSSGGSKGSGGQGGRGRGGANASGGTAGDLGGAGGASSGGGGGSGGRSGTEDAGPSDRSDGGKGDAGSGRAETGASDSTPSGSAAVQLMGRFDHDDSTPALFGWVGSALTLRFTGTGATIQLSGTDDRYAVLIDGVLASSLLKVTSKGTFEVAKGLAAGTHDVVIWRRTESTWWSSSYLGVEITGGQLLPPPARPDRRIEIYGDSITAGYGLDGKGPNCTVSQDNSNHYLTYGAVTARALSAELHTVAWSGIGMYRNYGQTAPTADSPTMPKVYDRIMPSPPSDPAIDNAWDFSRWQPHAVVINLGTNDASTNGDPGTPYRTAYLDFVRSLRQKYPDTFFVLSIGPMLADSALTAIRTHIQAVIKTRADEGDSRMSYLEFPTQVAADGYGCDWHPSPATNAKMADLLVAELKKQLSW
jgi:lysophospholipase L1-like esterase